MSSPQPGRDGEVLVYSPAKHSGHGPVVIYVNGIQTTPQTHAATATNLAEALGISVTGVFNQSGGLASMALAMATEATTAACRTIAPPARSSRPLFSNEGSGSQRALHTLDVGTERIGDFGRAAAAEACDATASRLESATAIASFTTDLSQSGDEWTKLGLRHLPSREFSLFERLVPGVREAAALGAAVRQLSRSLSDEMLRRQVARNLIVGTNPASRSMFDVLLRRLGEGGTPRVIAHSQGNIITSTALAGVAFVRQYRDLPVTVFSVASPAWAWPTAERFSLRGPYQNEGDFVPILGSLKAVTKAFPPSITAHDMDKYIRESPLIGDLRRDLALGPVALSPSGRGASGSW